MTSRVVRSVDVARRAGVSRSAVSRAFTDGASVSASTRTKVYQAAAELGYSPNAIARSLITSRTRIVGIVTAGLDNPAYAASLEEINVRLQRHKLASLLFIAPRLEQTDILVEQLLHYRVDALIITAAALSSNVVEQCTAARVPVVLCNRYTDSDLVTSIVSDNVEGGRDAAAFLVRAGHQHIAFIAGLDETSDGRDRARGFGERMVELGRPDYAEAAGLFSHDGAAAATRTLLGRARRPDAIFCANDVMAAACMDVVRGEAGLRVPDDVAVLGYDNSAIAQWPAYSMTSIDVNIAGIAELAVDAVVDAMNGQVSNKRILVAPRLVKRLSA